MRITAINGWKCTYIPVFTQFDMPPFGAEVGVVVSLISVNHGRTPPSEMCLSENEMQTPRTIA